MSGKSKILEFLNTMSKDDQKEVILECLSKIGTKEWIKRLDKIDKKE
jgi:hypothetical protein